MTGLQTNIFPILSLADLSSEYRLYRIKGLSTSQDEYYQNSQYIQRTLSYQLRSPVTIIVRDSTPYLAARADASVPPSPLSLVRRMVTFDPIQDLLRLDFTVRSPENDAICTRFLQFMIQEPLHSQSELWQPAAGQPFFPKIASSVIDKVVQYVGHSVRVVALPTGGLGLCVDVTSKFVAKDPLPVHMTRDSFQGWKGFHCLYHFGHQWYEIQIMGLDDQNATEYYIPVVGNPINLLNFIVDKSRKPIPPELANLPHDACVLLYRNNRDEERAAPGPLCYPVYGPDSNEGAAMHRKAILEPRVRANLTRRFVDAYLTRLRFGGTKLQVSREPFEVPTKIFQVPDFRFGKGRVLSVRGTDKAELVSLDELGRRRLSLLREVGFYDASPLDRQYFIVPASIWDSYGKRFLADLRQHVDQLFPQSDGYKPVVVTYNDRGAKTLAVQGPAILDAIKEQCQQPGYGVVMIHHSVDRAKRGEDALAGMVMRELREHSIYAAVIHTTVAQECYELRRRSDGEPIYEARQAGRGKLTGYLRNIAINKVLLTNHRWPFFLETRLHADITVGVDVKNNTVGLVVVGANGGEIRSLIRMSRQKEKLEADLTQALLVEIIRQEAQARSTPIITIVIHRDGRTFPSELRGANAALETLKQEGTVSPAATMTILEIPKNAPAPLRLYDVALDGANGTAKNPQVGSYVLLTDRDGYLCSTGRAFPRPGTVHPLHVRYVEGSLPFEKCLEDIYYLTALAWARPEDCSRYPITIKLNDRYLSEDATEYDTDALAIAEVLTEGTANE